ncbi:hypothetical protein [Mycolicibacterium canariasense]|uniref:hypothetical protein n=1 Tax=Mycolicibacterium canariasense TaxID=228230 RepID=UPI0032D5AB09
MTCGNAEIRHGSRAGPPEKHRHEGIGYVTPDDEHHGRGEAIRKARRAGLTAARNTRIATRRQMRHTHPKPTSSDEDI